MKKQGLKQTVRNEAIGIMVVGLACLGFVALYSDHNGVLGAEIKQGLSWLVGGGSPLILLLVGVWGILYMNERHRRWSWRTGGALLLFIVFEGFLHLQLPGFSAWPNSEILRQGRLGHGGGVLGAGVALGLKAFVGVTGSYIVLAIGALLGALLVVNQSLVSGLLNLQEALLEGGDRVKGQAADFIAVLRNRLPDRKEGEVEAGESKVRFLKPRGLGSPEERRSRETQGITDPLLKERPLVIQTGTEAWLGAPEIEAGEGRFEQLGFEGLSDPLTQVARRETGDAQEFAPPGRVTGTPISRQAEKDGDFTLPTLHLLHKSLKLKNARLNKDLADNVKTLEDTLESFGVKIKVTQVTQGPAITRYEAQPAPGVKVSRITNLADDIALSLAASDVRIEAPVPGKSVVGIEVPNKEIATVHFREVLEAADFQEAASKLTLVLGKDITGAPVIADLTKMPHLLIAGATGSGKSVCVNTIINSILFKARPDEVKFLLVDPKMVELANYNGIPHLIAPVVTDPRKAAGALKWIVTEMETRYELFAANGVRDIIRYNYLRQQDKHGEHPVLPYVVVIIDELSDLMMVAPGDVEDAICRLAQMARAAGIHLIVATQRPSVDVITGLIKANIPSRIAFAVSSQTDSRTILDMNGAEKLLGRGDMLFYPMGASKPMRVQGCFLADKEVENVVKFLQNQAKPEYQEIPQVDLGSGKTEEAGDELFYQAALLFVEAGNASVSLLQRRLRIGYTRAARLMDLMEEKGVVGGYEGSKPREVLMTRGQLEQKFGPMKDIQPKDKI